MSLSPPNAAPGNEAAEGGASRQRGAQEVLADRADGAGRFGADALGHRMAAEEAAKTDTAYQPRPRSRRPS